MLQTPTNENPIEIYTTWYFKELKDLGYVDGIIREPDKFECLPKFQYPRLRTFKKKPAIVEYINLFPEVTYTCDYGVYWNKKAEGLFYHVINLENTAKAYGDHFYFWANANANGEHVSYFDVKPPAAAARFTGSLSTFHTFPLKKRMLWETKRIYVEKFVPIPMSGSGMTAAIFPKTFTPRRYMLTDGGGQGRKIKFPVTSCEEYILSLEKEKSLKLEF